MQHSRTRLACSSCTRRKVKCSKTVPCTNCVRRGEQDGCTATEDRQRKPALDSPQRQTSVTSPIAQNESELSMLRHRVAQLESELQHQQTPLPTSPAESLHRRPGTAVGDQVSLQQESEGSTNSTQHVDTVAEDAASILEFLAWGRRKNPELPPIASPEAVAQIPSSEGVQAHATDSDIEALDNLPQMSLLQLLLPDRRRTWDLVLWHEQCLLWYHCSYHAPSLRSQLDNFYDKYNGSIENPEVNLQWVAFLFSVLTASITCLPPATAEAWGFRDAERATLSKRWFQAAITCLQNGDFASNHSILSVQTIATLTLSAHMLGFSNLHSTYLAAAVRIAQSLGLHRLSSDGISENLLDKEAGRRVWLQLCSQDWFSLPFSDTYLISPIYSKSELPMNCHDEELISLPDSIPTVSGYSRFLGSIAIIMPRLQDSLESCNTPFTRYEQVIKWDKQLRMIATESLPTYLSGGRLEPDWPIFVPWARRALAISSAHKIIMIHRSFLSKSFSNPAFSFTKNTCLAASKTIIKEFKYVVAENGPVLWIYQAFAVAASVILVLHLLHSDPSEPGNVEYFQLVHDTLDILKKTHNSKIASRGTKLISALLDQASATISRQTQKRTSNGRGQNNPPQKRFFNVSEFVKFFTKEQETLHPQNFLPRLSTQRIAISETLQSHAHLDVFDDESIENILHLASQDLYY